MTRIIKIKKLIDTLFSKSTDHNVRIRLLVAAHRITDITELSRTERNARIKLAIDDLYVATSLQQVRETLTQSK